MYIIMEHDHSLIKYKYLIFEHLLSCLQNMVVSKMVAALTGICSGHHSPRQYTGTIHCDIHTTLNRTHTGGHFTCTLSAP